MVRFLCFSEQAILKAAGSRQALWLGLSFVLLAGFFREYDQEDLLREPWHLIIPVASSFSLAVLLFMIVRHVGGSGLNGKLQPEFRRIATCMWMCSPMAILYAIPLEHLTSSRQATQLNIVILGIVATWRIFLMTRILAVLCRVTMWRMFGPVMLLADTLGMGLILAIPLPLIQVMGGVKLSESEVIINTVRANVIFLGVVSWLIWLFWTGYSVSQARKSRASTFVLKDNPVGWSAWMVSGLFAAIIIPACFWTQPLQQNRRQVEQLMSRGQVEEGVAFLASLQPVDLPPAWEMPPRLSYGHRPELVFQVLDILLKQDNPPKWLVNRYADKLIDLRGTGFHSQWFWPDRDTAQLEIMLRMFQRFPETRAPLLTPEEQGDGDISFYSYIEAEAGDEGPTHWNEIDPQRKELLTDLLGMAIEIDKNEQRRQLSRELKSRIEAEAAPGQDNEAAASTEGAD